ncbi:hypothetical protein C0Q70_15961 [Pomacea canaliculata]|uniref:Uncharacterized protein n=1 Tax=Pomacea canaliculata TaxID=400727 RepID=A0A2T7NNF4_POMCA|nr:hypothetical protein C0Q70_15961 [Pomacea canaliculata]
MKPSTFNSLLAIHVKPVTYLLASKAEDLSCGHNDVPGIRALSSLPVLPSHTTLRVHGNRVGEGKLQVPFKSSVPAQRRPW